MRKRQKNSDEKVNIGAFRKKAVFGGGGGEGLLMIRE